MRRFLRRYVNHSVLMVSPAMFQRLRSVGITLMAFSLVIFTVGILLVSEVFPDGTQALAGAVFNTVGQFGQAIGLALIGIVSDSVTQNSKYADKTTPDALWVGYRAGFWTCTGWMVMTCFIGALGLRKSCKVGLKRD